MSVSHRFILPGWASSSGSGHDPWPPCGLHRGGGREPVHRLGCHPVRGERETLRAHQVTRRPLPWSAFQDPLRPHIHKATATFTHALQGTLYHTWPPVQARSKTCIRCPVYQKGNRGLPLIFLGARCLNDLQVLEVLSYQTLLFITHYTPRPQERETRGVDALWKWQLAFVMWSQRGSDRTTFIKGLHWNTKATTGLKTDCSFMQETDVYIACPKQELGKERPQKLLRRQTGTLSTPGKMPKRKD